MSRELIIRNLIGETLAIIELVREIVSLFSYQQLAPLRGQSPNRSVRVNTVEASRLAVHVIGRSCEQTMHDH